MVTLRARAVLKEIHLPLPISEVAEYADLWKRSTVTSATSCRNNIVSHFNCSRPVFSFGINSVCQDWYRPTWWMFLSRSSSDIYRTTKFHPQRWNVCNLFTTEMHRENFSATYAFKASLESCESTGLIDTTKQFCIRECAFRALLGTTIIKKMPYRLAQHNARSLLGLSFFPDGMWLRSGPLNYVLAQMQSYLTRSSKARWET